MLVGRVVMMRWWMCVRLNRELSLDASCMVRAMPEAEQPHSWMVATKQKSFVVYPPPPSLPRSLVRCTA